MSSNEMLLLQAPLRLLVTLIKVGSGIDLRFGDLPVTGVGLTVLTTIATVLAGFQYQNALRSGGSGATVSAIAGAYPAVAYIIGVVMGTEEATRNKILGVIFATLSCYMFSL